MNYSVLYLSAALYLTSPFLSISKSSTNYDLCFHQVRFFKSFSHFLYSQSNLASYQLKKSQIKFFLSSSIRINTEDYSARYFYHENLVFRRSVELSLIDSVFESCSSDSLGGAIQIISSTRDNTILNLTNCVFDKCNSFINGGAIYALVSRFIIQMTCFKHCYSNECQVANLRGESRNMHSINFTTICLNGFQSNEQYNSDEKDKSITFTSFSNIIVVVNNNNTKNSVSHNSGGQQIISNFMAYLKYSTFSNNIGESILHISLKNDKSSIEYINILNNSAILKFHGNVICFAKTAFGHFVFINNLYPLITTGNQGVLLIDCVFDIPKEFIEDDKDDENIDNDNFQKEFKFFNGNVSYTHCVFDKHPTPQIYSQAPSQMCVNRFSSNNDNESSGSFLSMLWPIIIIAFIAGIIFLSLYMPKAYIKRKKYDDEERDERAPFINKYNQKYF